jgi:hypothetical protein
MVFYNYNKKKKKSILYGHGQMVNSYDLYICWMKFNISGFLSKVKSWNLLLFFMKKLEPTCKLHHMLIEYTLINLISIHHCSTSTEYRGTMVMESSRILLFFFYSILIHFVKPTIAQRDPYVHTIVILLVTLQVTVPTGQTSTTFFLHSLLKPKWLMGSTISLPERTPTKLTPLHFVEQTLHQPSAVVVSICLLTSSYSCVQTRRRVSCGTRIVQFDTLTDLYLVVWNLNPCRFFSTLLPTSERILYNDPLRSFLIV